MNEKPRMLTTDFQQIIDLSEVQTTETNCDHFYGFNTQKTICQFAKKLIVWTWLELSHRKLYGTR